MITPGVLVFTAAVTGAIVSALAVLDRAARRRRMRIRLASMRTRLADPARTAAAPDGSALSGLVAGIGGAIVRSGLLSRRTLDELEATLQAGGQRSRNALGLFVGAKILMFALLPLLAFLPLRYGLHLSSFKLIVAVCAAAVGGLLLPDRVIRSRRQTYLKLVERGLADALDMMVICAEAGLALEGALRKVAKEIRHAHPQLATELDLTTGELNLIADSRVALANLGRRTGVASLKRLGATLIQTVQYGTPLGHAMRTLAVELRQETMTRYEERAARLPVLLTIPMILFILPCVFLVVAGPVAVQVMRVMKH